MNKTDKINQHYVPQFYLRNFSIDTKKNSIGTYLITSNTFINSTKIKNQASKKYYYGEDGLIEDELGKWESKQSPLVKSIIQGNLPQIGTENHKILISLFSLLHLRNPIIIDNFKKLLNVTGEIKHSNFLTEEALEEYTKKMGFKFFNILSELLRDLHFKTLKNKTHIPFITSDFPVVRYNLYLEKFSTEVASIAYGISGIKFFLPLDSETCLVLYDSNIYKIGNKKDKYIDITDPKEINQLNLLQVLNNSPKLFFGKNISEIYLNDLVTIKKKENFNIQNTYPVKKGNIVLAERCINIRLKISCIKIHSKAKHITHIINNDAPLRKHYQNLVNAGKII